MLCRLIYGCRLSKVKTAYLVAVHSAQKDIPNPKPVHVYLPHSWPSELTPSAIWSNDSNAVKSWAICGHSSRAAYLVAIHVAKEDIKVWHAKALVSVSFCLLS